MLALEELAKDNDAQIFIDVLPGDRVLSGLQLARIAGKIDPDAVADCFTLASNRSYEQDPRYAIQAMRETASKALSPGINDPGTAVEVIARLERVIWDALRTDVEKNNPIFERLYVKELAAGTLIDLAFRDIARDGAGLVDVLLAIATTISTLSEQCGEVAGDTIDDLRIALNEHAEAGLSTDAERKAFRAGSVLGN